MWIFDIFYCFELFFLIEVFYGFICSCCHDWTAWGLKEQLKKTINRATIIESGKLSLSFSIQKEAIKGVNINPNRL
ncbi:hypothetical protein AAX22_08555 [Oenococcus oeni]|nr:hypothetical protein AAX22_08555 [Oenococcus oeni]